MGVKQVEGTQKLANEYKRKYEELATRSGSFGSEAKRLPVGPAQSACHSHLAQTSVATRTRFGTESASQCPMPLLERRCADTHK